MNAQEEVRELLQKFQSGYTQRDAALLDEFMELFVDSEELEVIGTNTLRPGEGEWCRGLQEVRSLVQGDWEHWGDVLYDVEGAHISVRGTSAWLTTTATVTDTIPVQDRLSGYLAFVESVLGDPEMSQQAKTLEITGLGNSIVQGLALSETYVWPFRLSGVALKEGGRWRFVQLHFSFATTGAPDVRLPSEAADNC